MTVKTILETVMIGGVNFMYLFLSALWSAFLPIFNAIYEAISSWWTYSVLPIKEEICNFLQYFIYGVVSPMIIVSILIWGYVEGTASFKWLITMEIVMDVIIILASRQMIKYGKLVLFDEQFPN